MVILKRSLLFFFFLSFTLWSFGQVSVGAFAGLNVSRFSGDVPDNSSYKSLMGANVGAFVDVKLTESLALSLQPSYSQEGTKISYTISSHVEPIDSVTIRLNYFSLPLLLKVTSTNKRYYAVGGLETAFLIDHYASSNDIKEDIETEVADINIAMHFGAGYRIPLGYPTLSIELRYSQGLVNLTDEPVNESYIPRVKTTGFKIFAVLELPLTKSSK